jgi:hypothetical protein
MVQFFIQPNAPRRFHRRIDLVVSVRDAFVEFVARECSSQMVALGIPPNDLRRLLPSFEVANPQEKAPLEFTTHSARACYWIERFK